MWRRLRLLIIFIPVGAIITFAVAWACAIMLPQQMPPGCGEGSSRDLRTWLSRLPWAGFGEGRNHLSLQRALSPGVPTGDWREIFSEQRTDYDWNIMADRTTHTYVVDLCGSGWPCISHVVVIVDDCERTYRPYLMNSQQIREVWDGWKPPEGWLPQRGSTFKTMTPFAGDGTWYLDSLPICIVWPGFLIDTAMYGALAFLLWFAPGALRRSDRRRRGRCISCGYDLRGIASTSDAPGTAGSRRCPECGHLS